MKYFTKDWCLSEVEDYKIEERLKSYEQYIDSVYESLPFALKILARNVNFHDGRLEKITVIQNERKLILKGIFGDLEVGYFFLEIKYLGVTNLDPGLLFLIFEKQEVEVLSSEIEVLEGNLFSHRMFFSTKKDIDIQFCDVEIVIQNASVADYRNSLCQID
ncbi:MAG: hypothetical protein HYX48_01730 [Chlamydiales bacterium]|nr:hypothetical protein [Chlamydiales bacterium]